jgi:hypothetical protein
MTNEPIFPPFDPAYDESSDWLDVPGRFVVESEASESDLAWGHYLESIFDPDR